MSEKISIIVPMHNAAEYLRPCIESILKQTYRNFELILVDDGSTDETLIICQEFKDHDSRVRYVTSNHLGVGAARNRGLELATGQYITFIDSDDFIQVEYLDRLYHNLQTNRSDIVVCNFAHFDTNKQAYLIHVTDEEKQKVLEKCYTPAEWLSYEGVGFNCLDFLVGCPHCKLYKRSLFENIVYPQGIMEDEYTTWKIYLNASKISYLNYDGYAYRIGHQGTITKASKKSMFYEVESTEEKLAMYTLLGIDTTNLTKKYQWRLYKIKENALRDGDLYHYNDAKFKLRIISSWNK